jgi:DNA topoisomerase-3
VVESSTHFICERKLKEADLGEGVERPKSCGFIFPRTVCKREITRDEAIHYVTNKRTELLTDFTSRYGRPFSAILVLKETGRHGFEFPPRAPRAPKEPGAEGEATAEAPKRPARGRKRASAEKTAAATDTATAKPARKRAAKSTKVARKPKAKTPKTDD